MYKIVYLRSDKEGKRLRLGVIVDGETVSLRLTEAEYLDMGSPAVGCELGDGELSELRALDERHRALNKALSLLSYSDKNERTLLMRLLNCGFSRESAREAVRTCVSLGYINEERQLQRLVVAEWRKLYGRRAIVARLCAKSYSRADIERTVDELEGAGEIDFSESFRRLCEKYGSHEGEQLLKLKYKYGY